VVAGKYELGSVVGEGGMGLVFAARHAILGHTVAVKTVRPSLLTEDEISRFLEEGKKSAAIQSEHVARVLDVGIDDATGAPYMALEFLEGATLAQVLAARRKLPLAEVVDWMLQACEGVAEAHALGIVHRDLKPENLFLAERRIGPPIVKVLDFGVAKAKDDVDPMCIGTPQYMSPEQICGDEVDARSDVWSLGAVLYELLTGEPLFRGRSIGEIVMSILRCEVPATGQPEVDAILARALAREPANRFASIGEFAAALAPLAPDSGRASLPRIPLSGPVPAQKGSASPEPFASTVKVDIKPRRRWAWFAAGLVAAAIFGWSIGRAQASDPHGDNRVTLPSSDWREDVGNVGHVLESRAFAAWPEPCKSGGNEAHSASPNCPRRVP
jgi:serine/threonine-protein kinase